MRRAAGYYRLSMEDKEGKAESNSITNQRLLIKKYVSQDTELSQYEYCEFYDDGYSGTTMNRPGMQEMLERIRKNEIHVVIVKDLSRFSRDYIELGTYMEQIFPFMGIRFIAITDRYDSRDSIGRTVDMDLAFKSLMADFYCKDVSAKVNSSLEAKRKLGKYCAGLVPFGYTKDKKDPNKLVVVPEEAEVIRYIFRLSVMGHCLTEICRKLNDEGIMTPLEYQSLRKKQNRKESERSTRFWQAGTVRTILTNESYIGNMVYDKTEPSADGSGKRIVKQKAEWKVFENHHEPIVDRDVFVLVQTKFNRRKVTERMGIEYPLKGKVFCGYCKRTLKVIKLAGGRLSFYCPNERISSRAECMAGTFDNGRLERIVLNEIKRQLVFLADWNRILQELRSLGEECLKERETELAGLERKLQELTEQKAACLEEYHAGIVDKTQFLERRKEIAGMIENMKTEYERKKKEIRQRMKFMNWSPYDWEDLFRFAGMDCLTGEMAGAFVDDIEIDRNRNIDIYLAFNCQCDCSGDNTALT